MANIFKLLYIFWPLLLAATSCSGRQSVELTAGAPSLGSRDADAVIVIFSDYQCGPCAALGRRVAALIEERGDELRLVYRHCPSSRHPLGRRAARLAIAAHQLGVFWPLHWRLVRSGPITDDEQLELILEDAGVDSDQLRARSQSPEVSEILAADRRLADRLGLRGTPTLFVGRRRIEGSVSLERLRRELTH